MTLSISLSNSSGNFTHSCLKTALLLMQLCVVLFYSHPCTTLEFEVFFVSYDQTSLKVRYRELDIFKILGILWEFFWRRFFGGIILEEFFARNFSEDDFGKIFFQRNSLGGILTLLKSAKLFEYGRN